MRTEDELRKALSDAAQRAAGPSPDARARVGRVVRRQRAWRVGAVAGVAIALAAFGIVTITRPQHQASVRVVSPGPSPSPSPSAAAGPEPDTAPSNASSQSDFVPAGFSAVSITFVSPKDGFVLGSAPCAAAQPCTVILRTADTGKTWHRIGAPAASAVETESGPPAIREIRFATSDDGWVFGSELWSTHDGGSHWTQVPHAGDVYDLEAAAGRAHMIVLGESGYRIWSTPVARDAWVVADVVLQKGPAPVAAAQLVLQGRSGWALVDDRVVYDGARLGPNGWSKWVPPCMDAFGHATLLAPTPTELNAVCAEGTWGGDRPPGTGLYTSSDGGSTFVRASKSVPSSDIEAASGSPDTIVVPGSRGPEMSVLWATFDRGASWSVVYTGVVSELGFTTPTQGIGLDAVGPSGAGRFLLSTDGGHHWRATPFGPTASADRRCTTADLRVALADPAQQGVSQQQTLTFAFTNSAASGCWMEGYPGISMLTPDGAPVPFNFERSGDQVITSKPPRRVVLEPGGAAWVSVNKSVCQASAKTSATTVRLIPPDERQSISVTLPSAERQWAACDSSEPGHVVHVSPVAATPHDTTSL